MSSLLSGPCFYDGVPADLRPLPDEVEETHRKDDGHRAEVRGRVPIRQLPAHHKQVTCKLSALNLIHNIHYQFTQLVTFSNSFLLYWPCSSVRRLHSIMEISERNRRFILLSRSWWEYLGPFPHVEFFWCWNDYWVVISRMNFTLRLTTCTILYFSVSPWAW